MEVFVETLGYEPILSEYGAIAYDPTQPLDESCYREAQSSDMLVLIVGGRYGSAVSSTQPSARKRDEEFESVTRREFARAHDADIPVYVLIEQGVFSEYQTYLRNKDNDSIRYAHVDSVKVFNFIEFIYSKQRNNPIQPFEKGADIENWLKDQWAGLFQELLRQRKDGSRFSDLASQIRQLEAVNTTLKSYLESVLQSISPNESKDIIDRENQSLSRANMIEKVRENTWFDFVKNKANFSDLETLDLHLKIGSVGEIVEEFDKRIIDPEAKVTLLDTLRKIKKAQLDFNNLRAQCEQPPVRFTKKFKSDVRGYISKIIATSGYSGPVPEDLDEQDEESIESGDEG